MIKKFVKCLAFCSCLAFGLFNGDCWGMNNGHNTEDSDSDSSSHSSTSSSLSEEWIASNKELVSKACYEESSFDSLIDEIAKCSDSVEVRRELYEGIENTWNEKNVFGATVLDDGSFAIFNAENFD